MKILNEIESNGIFNRLSKNIPDILSNLDINLDSNIIKPEWEQNRTNFRNELLNGIEYNFLTNSNIRGLMFQGDEQLANIEMSKMERHMLGGVVEYGFSNRNYTSENISTNTVHHLYHLYRFLENNNKSNIGSIIEWGGGYGNMAKLCFEKFNNLKSYTIVDIPEFVALQYVYLSSYFGEDKVNIVSDISECVDGINLISVKDVIDKEIYKPDMFLSTWAITESSMYCQEYVEKQGLLDSDNLLISYHQCGNHIPFMYESSIMDLKMKEMRAHIERIDFIPGINYYAIK